MKISGLKPLFHNPFNFDLTILPTDTLLSHGMLLSPSNSLMYSESISDLPKVLTKKNPSSLSTNPTFPLTEKEIDQKDE